MYFQICSQAIENRIAQEKRAVSEKRVENKRPNDIHHRDFEAVILFFISQLIVRISFVADQ